jgi:NAD(P)-dependent dehydrogenase (short-subunit alcohol dehydrogenase family)
LVVSTLWSPISVSTVSGCQSTITPDEWDATVRLNLRGTYLTLNRTVPLMKDRGRRSIVVVASINGVRAFTNPGAMT